ncbi:MAG: hypothetical protein AB203_01310 [Parcubacteria bacterium C7867-008]|nr:MAG: hypothetical protein AB203_01310 [Parcubacteria bacterium C7867-008]
MIQLPLSTRVGIILLACVSPFIFPAAITVVLAFGAAFIFPPIAIAIGMLTDLLYEPSGYLPIGSIIGLVLCIVAALVRTFVKTRIM